MLGAAFAVQALLLAFSPPWGTSGFLLLDAAVATIGVIAFVAASRSARAWRARARDPLVLDPPFEGSWRVVAGGAYPGLNHHHIAKDQYFAYDFMRRGAPSRGSAILAPIAGRVVAAVDGMEDRPPSRNPDHPSVRGRELGNHVAIACGRGAVFLCHLQNGSVCVRPGQDVVAGERIGACGNSGRTTWPHLHIHAQDAHAYAFDRANGIPIGFRNGTETKLLGYASVLVGR
jgi:murein DD-endopeptidase MepM/ murein hydrolase activator NlpD